MNNEEMVKIELVGYAWQEWGDFAGVKFITIPKINLNEVAQEFTFKGKRWSYLPASKDYCDGYAIKINPCGEDLKEGRTMLASLPPEPKPRPEWISFKTIAGFEVVINVKSIKSMVRHSEFASIKDSDSDLLKDCFKISHETYEQIKKQLVGEV